ncbi:LOW QUALITY PROTEIN: odorant receptor 49b [Drosophila gunungcola]|uniref:LOW QUALITY PROTEIN: odorant receptor 49b n=1 Tax=Drosophila gunungcola TaxID=103775 RepID=UPI0022E3D7CE|nr:LOW QUALITY PROTEIN: odorant receptor 49b [Drosophila gunungcola]
MFEDIQLIYMNIRILRFWAFLYDRNAKCYACIGLASFHIFTQLVYMMSTNEGLTGIIRNSYMLVLWINTVLRAYLLLADHDRYVALIQNLTEAYYDLLNLNDTYISRLLVEVNRVGQLMARGNLFFGMLTSLGFGLYPLSSSERVLPFGSRIPGLNEYESPYYEMWYVFQMLITPMGCCMYIPYTSLIVGLIMFGIVRCKALQHRLRQVAIRYPDGDRDSRQLREEIIACIRYQQGIIEYMDHINELTTMVFLFELMAFSALLCALLFMLIIVSGTSQLIIVCMYINMILAQILALYWYANELREQNLAVATAAYDMEWYTFDVPVRKNIIFMMMRAQRPASILLGSIRPITLELFQNLLNTTYTFFTVLKRVYG